jgi:predicted ArsR family transcriptional regulator
MIKIDGSKLSDDELQFIHQISSLLEPWGMPTMSTRVYGYLLLNRGLVSVNQIAADLGTSKVAAWNAAKSLEAFGHVKRHGEPGSKRALYGPTDNFDVPVVKQCLLLGSLGELLQNRADALAKGDVATRLQQMSEFYLSMQQAMQASIKKLNVARAKKR